MYLWSLKIKSNNTFIYCSGQTESKVKLSIKVKQMKLFKNSVEIAAIYKAKDNIYTCLTKFYRFMCNVRIKKNNFTWLTYLMHISN